ncbi:molybdenum-binding protein [Clostridium sp. D2Q-14]|uniref:winged helix-turn-helix domain-containing protein n=1 Tax=Anaeromonas gelatinilytica TaxID=2683194 RepID=UPI00193BBD33|nr:molybdenum-binding protein [Anaeromonas gelatinilytica]MBS4534571.1 molybdenum-binding protein [Anaeromonas gelatinilytica]
MYSQYQNRGDFSLKLRYKVWIEGKEKAFGKGPYELLLMIEQVGSINMACKKLNMSYSKGYNIIKTGEKELGFTFLNRQIGGKFGGGCELTSEARELISAYKDFNTELEDIINELSEKYFRKII